MRSSQLYYLGDGNREDLPMRLRENEEKDCLLVVACVTVDARQPAQCVQSCATYELVHTETCISFTQVSVSGTVPSNSRNIIVPELHDFFHVMLALQASSASNRIIFIFFTFFELSYFMIDLFM